MTPVAESRATVIAREALEQVCTGARLDDAGEYYSERFVDHVNAKEHRGLEGVRQSVRMYRQLFGDPRFEVLQQVTEGDSVASRFAVHGVHRGRRVRLTGIVISRIEEGRIVEDFVATDSFEVARQLGIWRTLLFVLAHPRALQH